MLVNKPRPNPNRFMQLEERKIFKYRESNALILYKYISSVLFYQCVSTQVGNGLEVGGVGHAVLQ